MFGKLISRRWAGKMPPRQDFRVFAGRV